MSKEMREYLNKVKNWIQFNESIERIDIKYNKYGGEVFLLDKKIGHFWILDMDKYLVIDSIKIDEDFRGRGIGENVIRDIINHYPHNIISITPSPFEPNFNNLIKFYKRIGFVENIGENKIEYIKQPFYFKKYNKL